MPIVKRIPVRVIDEPSLTHCRHCGRTWAIFQAKITAEPALELVSYHPSLHCPYCGEYPGASDHC